MRITDIHIDGFGVWNDLRIERLAPDITVFYGPNEAGKSTLMNFLRSVLYGVSAKRRQRYLPPFAGGRPGGSLSLESEGGKFEVRRYADRSEHDTGKVSITTAEGDQQGDRLLREVLEHVDEPTYNNIYAVGLTEIQELGTISDTAAAQWLYRLTSGLDRISLYDVMHLLRGSLARLLGPADKKSEIRELVARRDQLSGELQELVVKGRRWAQSAVKLGELTDEINHLQAELKRLERESRCLETAINLKPLWTKRERLEEDIASFAGLFQLPETAIAELDELNDKIAEHERQRDILRGQRHQLRDEAESLGINEILVRESCRLSGLAEQQEWLASLERQAEDIDTEARHLESRLADEQQRLAARWAEGGAIAPEISPEVVEQLAPQATAIETTDELVERARAQLADRQQGERTYRSQLEQARTSGDKLGLPADIERTSDLVGQLRQRADLERDYEQRRRELKDLDRESRHLIESQVIPLPVFGWLLGAFTLGTTFWGMRLVVPETPLGEIGGWLGTACVGGAGLIGLYRFFVSRSRMDRLDICESEIDRLESQLEKQAKERKVLDDQLQLAEGAYVVRLEQAERHLNELEKAVPVESQRRAAEQEITAAEQRLEQACEKQRAALANWRNKLHALGLPEGIAPSDLSALALQYEKLTELRQRAEGRREDVERRQREFNTIAGRIRSLAEETSLYDPQLAPLAQLELLMVKHREQRALLAHRDSLREKAKELKAEEVRHARAAIGLGRRRQSLFQTAGVETEQAYRTIAEKLAEVARLREKRQSVSREITAAIGKQGREEDFVALLSPETAGRLEGDWEQINSHIESVDHQLKETLEERGKLVEQQRRLAEDRSLAHKQMELDTVEAQLRTAFEGWRERAVVSLILERIRDDYEQHRQPETLLEATSYLKQLTSGRYTRIWTPLANDILLVEKSDGQSLPVEVLSRGTREQLFLSLRLALVAMYARRGINLPMILDDVLVNYDAGRAEIAARVLREFANEGHQLLIFTCHEHIWRMFKSHKADVRRLPDRYSDQPVIEQGTTIDDDGFETPTLDKIPNEPVAVEAASAPVVQEMEEVVVKQKPAPPPIEYEYEIPEPLVEYEYEVPSTPVVERSVQSDREVEVEYEWPEYQIQPRYQPWSDEQGHAHPLPEPIVELATVFRG